MVELEPSQLVSRPEIPPGRYNVPVVVAVGLRERKKANTRALIIETADRFFLERGFGAVTLEEIADACELSVRTVLRYFETKDALALATESAAVERFREGLRRHEGSALDYWRYFVGIMSAEFAARADWHRARYQMLRREPLFSAYNQLRREVTLELADALTQPPDNRDPFTAHLLASALLAGNDYVVDQWFEKQAAFDPDALLHAVDFVTELFSRPVRTWPPAIREGKRAPRRAR